MASKERIKVAFRRVSIKRPLPILSGNWFKFSAVVAGRRIEEKALYNSATRRDIALPEAHWSSIVEVDTLEDLFFEFVGELGDRVRGEFVKQDEASAQAGMFRPFRQQFAQRLETNLFAIEFNVELESGGKFGRHPDSAIFASRFHRGSASFTTVSGDRQELRAEIHPVTPTPMRPENQPARPKMSAGIGPAEHLFSAEPVEVDADSPINVLPNPALIPILGSKEATAETAARIRVTYYRPRSFAFKKDDPRLTWTSSALGSGAALAFVGDAKGTEVLVRGVREGEVLLHLHWAGMEVARYRALVAPLKKLPYRVNLLKHADYPTRSFPKHVIEHFAVANRYLRQAGLELVLDTDPSTDEKRNREQEISVSQSRTPGIFYAWVRAHLTHNLVDQYTKEAASVNYRPGVLNFCYIHSVFSRRMSFTKGIAVLRPASRAGDAVRDSGTPSASWVKPSGVKPDGPAKVVEMKLIGEKLHPEHPRAYGVLLVDRPVLQIPWAPEDRPETEEEWREEMEFRGEMERDLRRDEANAMGRTIAHELGHVLNLRHRPEKEEKTKKGAFGDGVYDGMKNPPQSNLMNYGTGARTQDFDIIQVKAMRESPVLLPD